MYKGSSDMSTTINTPDQHGFVMLGTNTLFLEHLPMFTMENHRFQVILKVNIPRYAMDTYIIEKQKNKDKPFILGNLDTNLFTLPQVKNGQLTGFIADIFCGVPSDPNSDTPLLHNVPVTIEKIIHYRHFAEHFDYPSSLTYLLFGEGSEIFISHYIAKKMDFQQIIEVPVAPNWLSAELIETGVLINIPSLSNENVLDPNSAKGSEFEVQYEGQSYMYSLTLGKTIWFETENLNGTHNHDIKK